MEVPDPKFSRGQEVVIQVHRAAVGGDRRFAQRGMIRRGHFLRDFGRRWYYQVEYITPSGRKHTLCRYEDEITVPAGSGKFERKKMESATATKTPPPQSVMVEPGTFSWALDRMKAGYKVARAGWNGKGMWISVSPGSKALPADRFWNPHNKAFAMENGGHADVQPYITMKTAQNQIQMGWLASQSDMLADDWQIVE